MYEIVFSLKGAPPAGDISHPNKFQSLLSSPHIRLYTSQERSEKAVVIPRPYLLGTLLPSLRNAAQEYALHRAQAVKRKIEKGGVSAVYPNKQTALITESLFDPHFRKQCKYGPSREEVAAKVGQLLEARRPLHLVGLMFTRKNICPLKRNGGDESVVDFAEILSFTHLNAFCSLIHEFYPYGVTYTVLSEGMRFLSAFHLCEPAVRIYQKRIRSWIDFLDLSHMRLLDYEDFLRHHLGSEEQEKREDEYRKALELYTRTMYPLLDPCDMQTTLRKAIEKDPVTDARNLRNNFVPLWDSMKNSLPYPELQAYAQEQGREFDEVYRDFFADITRIREDSREEELRRQLLDSSWKAAIEHNARVMGDNRAGLDVGRLVDPLAFRTSINPKPGSHLGIFAMRETTSRVQPWHGTAFVRTDGVGRLTATVLSKLEIETANGLPVFIDERSESSFCYVTDTAAAVLQGGVSPAFNVSTRL